MATTPAGRRNKRITFQRAIVARSTLGGTSARPTDWEDVPSSSRWAQISWGSGAERRAAAAEEAVQTATFRVLSDSLTRTITEEHRIVHGALTFDVTGAVPIGVNDEIEFTGTASKG